MAEEVKPTFLIVGAAKAGTTSVYHYLRQHPDLFMPASIKETFFFSSQSLKRFTGPGHCYAKEAIMSVSAYLDLFVAGREHTARGEACTAYLYFYHEAIPRIRAYLGTSTRILILLRDPVERAYSNYMHHVRDGLEPLSFAKAIAASDARNRAGWWWGFQYVDVGRYFGQVKAYQEAFGQDQVLVVPYDALEANAVQVVQRMYRFLGVDDAFRPDTSRRYNVTGLPRAKTAHRLLTGVHPLQVFAKRMLPDSLRERLKDVYYQRAYRKPPLPDQVRRSLKNSYRCEMEQLQKIVDFDVSRWW